MEKQKIMKTRTFSVMMVLFFTAFLFAGNAKGSIKVVRNASSLEIEMEPSMKMESWMINESLWISAHVGILAEDCEEALPLEAWMTDFITWNASLLTAKDESLNLEDWMTDMKWWDTSSEGVVSLDESMILEPWMMDGKYWSKPGSR